MSGDLARPDAQMEPKAEEFVGSVLDQLRGDAGPGIPWWETSTAAVIVDISRAMSFVVALAGITLVLQEGADPDWVAGGDSAADAFGVAQEWLTAGVDPSEVAGWLRAGCWDPKAARRMIDVGLRPSRLLDEEGKPIYLVDEGPDGEIPVALAVADSYITVADAVRAVTGRPPGRPGPPPEEN